MDAMFYTPIQQTLDCTPANISSRRRRRTDIRRISSSSYGADTAVGEQARDFYRLLVPSPTSTPMCARQEKEKETLEPVAIGAARGERPCPHLLPAGFSPATQQTVAAAHRIQLNFARVRGCCALRTATSHSIMRHNGRNNSQLALHFARSSDLSGDKGCAQLRVA